MPGSAEVCPWAGGVGAVGAGCRGGAGGPVGAEGRVCVCDPDWLVFWAGGADVAGAMWVVGLGADIL